MKGPIRRMSLPFQKGNILLSEYLWETRSLKDYFEDINNNYCQYEIQLQTTFSVAKQMSESLQAQCCRQSRSSLYTPPDYNPLFSCGHQFFYYFKLSDQNN